MTLTKYFLLYNMTMIDSNTIRQVLHINECNKKRLKLNGKYICEFADSRYFSEFAKDNNCSRTTCYADVIAYDDSRCRKLMNGKVYISHDSDLGVNGLYSMSLQFEDNDVKSIVTVTDCAVEDAFENMNELANKINASLHNTYDNKKEC